MTGSEPREGLCFLGPLKLQRWDGWVTGQGNQKFHGPWQLYWRPAVHAFL